MIAMCTPKLFRAAEPIESHSLSGNDVLLTISESAPTPGLSSEKLGRSEIATRIEQRFFPRNDLEFEPLVSGSNQEVQD
jgi:hypothetical protein